MTDRQLIPGRFYWAIPVFDVDTDENWINDPQPARYVGNDTWQWIDTEGDEWPAGWVGAEITDPSAASDLLEALAEAVSMIDVDSNVLIDSPMAKRWIAAIARARGELKT